MKNGFLVALLSASQVCWANTSSSQALGTAQDLSLVTVRTALFIRLIDEQLPQDQKFLISDQVLNAQVQQNMKLLKKSNILGSLEAGAVSSAAIGTLVFIATMSSISDGGPTSIPNWAQVAGIVAMLGGSSAASSIGSVGGGGDDAKGKLAELKTDAAEKSKISLQMVDRTSVLFSLNPDQRAKLKEAISDSFAQGSAPDVFELLVKNNLIDESQRSDTQKLLDIYGKAESTADVKDATTRIAQEEANAASSDKKFLSAAGQYLQTLIDARNAGDNTLTQDEFNSVMKIRQEVRVALSYLPAN